ncbi:MAG TPA: FAD-dependent oxidoreductase, partial [Pseudobdellovibrionaceae bacterium]
MDVIIVGGGFYGCCLAIEMASKGKSVLLLEREASLLSRASYSNQARIHGGYHYPRSFLTGVRSRENFKLFVEAFEGAVVRNFTKLYAIAQNSKVTAKQFFEFCNRIKAPIKMASGQHIQLFSKESIESVFEVEEYAFDSQRLAQIVQKQMAELGVEVRRNSTVTEMV